MRLARTWTCSIGSDIAVKYFLLQERKIHQTHELQEGCRKPQAQLLTAGTKLGFPTLHPERLKERVLENPPGTVLTPVKLCSWPNPAPSTAQLWHCNQSDVNGKGKKLISVMSKCSDTGPGEQGMWGWPLIHSLSALRACSWLFQSILFSSAHGIFIGSFKESPKSPAESTQ